MIWIVGICNSINFFDNMDGGAAGTVAISSLALGYLGYQGVNTLSLRCPWWLQVQQSDFFSGIKAQQESIWEMPGLCFLESL